MTGGACLRSSERGVSAECHFTDDSVRFITDYRSEPILLARRIRAGSTGNYYATWGVLIMSVRKNRGIRGAIVLVAAVFMALALSAPATAEPLGNAGGAESSVAPFADYCEVRAGRPTKFGDAISSYGWQRCEGDYQAHRITVELLRWNGIVWDTRALCVDGWSTNSTVGCGTPGTPCTGQTWWKTLSRGEARWGSEGRNVYSPEVYFSC